ncbi:FG-GAP repeat domain-containing protein [Streptomyces tanashiensis]|uniref:FG-GAP repeat domain-containing protein n=1 Tax=Streptomyces tanashiensis TaxID=67367 RepID=UPI0033E50ACD
MSRAHASRRRLAAAVTAALAVTVGAVVAVPAEATPTVLTAASQSTEPDAVVPFPASGYIDGAGPSGFLSLQVVDGKSVFQWTRYADGTVTTLPAGAYSDSPRTDIVRKAEGTVHKLYDMATGADPVVIDTSVLGEGYVAVGTAGSSVVMTKPNTTGGQDVRLVGKPQDTVVDRRVTGLPDNAAISRVFVSSPEAAVVLYSLTDEGAVTHHAAVVDLTAGTVVSAHDTPPADEIRSIALSATHLAWVEKRTTYESTLVTVRRDTGAAERVPLKAAFASVLISIVGDWVTYGRTGGYDASSADPLHALTARSLTTGATVKLLDGIKNHTPGPDGTQMVRGGTVAGGEGLYRISVGADGTPAATLVASTGIPTAYSVVSESVPAVIDFDRDPGPVSMTWTLSRSRGSVQVELVHTATGRKITLFDHSGGAPAVRTVTWDGTFVTYNPSIPARYVVPAPNGDYTWKMTGRPSNGIGPLLRTGTFKIVRKAVPHDFNDNGAPDILVREHDGALSLYNTSQPLGSWTAEPPTPLGTGWNVYDRLVTPGNIAGAPQSDIVARDKSGVLWLHQGTGRTLAPRTRIGGGWGIYQQITGGSDLDGDGRPDLLATDGAGALWLYKGTGSATAPFAARTQIGRGWGIYNRITAVDNIAGGPAGDLVARDTSGVLWLYLGKGDGTFAPRTRIGGGWNTYDAIVGFGDADRDGRAALLASDKGSTYVYKGTGNWRAPFETRRAVYSYDTIDWSAPVF